MTKLTLSEKRLRSALRKVRSKLAEYADVYRAGRVALGAYEAAFESIKIIDAALEATHADE